MHALVRGLRRAKLASEVDARTQQLEQHVNKNPPPSIGSDRQKTGQQLEFSEPPVQHGIKPPSGIPNLANKAQSRKAAA